LVELLFESLQVFEPGLELVTVWLVVEWLRAE